MQSRRHQDTNFSHTEEAFLLSSLREVVNVWARGYGQASFNLAVRNGVAELNMGFQLGHPADPHLGNLGPPVHPEQVPQQQQQPKQPRRKGPARRERDRARAAKHQAFHKPEESVSDEVIADVILPFTGKMLPITATQETPMPKQPLPSTTKTPTPDAAPASRPAPSSPASRTIPASPAPGAAPTKSTFTPARYVDMNVNNVKKMLFPRSDVPHLPSPAQSGKPKFQRREEQLWTKLFK